MENQATTAHVETPWSRADEKNWAADRAVLRDLKKSGEQPSEWLAVEYAELDARRKAGRLEERRAKQEAKLQAHVEKSVALMATQLTPQHCREIASILLSR
jgi:hypothetical protein